MNLYKIKTDYDHFQLLLPKDREHDYFKDTLGEPIGSWDASITWALFNKTAKDRKRRKDFNACCYYSNILFFENTYEEKLQALISPHVQLLPVNAPEVNKTFLYVNILNLVDAINEDNLTTEEALERARNNERIFRIENVKDKTLFRDSIYKGYFCTDKFIDWCSSNDVVGLRFVIAGTAI